MLPQCTFNEYFKTLSLENDLFLALDKIKSLERLMASKDYIIFQMITCNAIMAKSSTSFIPPPPPLPSDLPLKKDDYEVNDLFEDGVAPENMLFPTGKSAVQTFTADLKTSADLKAAADVKTADLKNVVAANDIADADSKIASFVESQMRQGGGGSRLTIDPRKPLLPRPCL